MNKQGKDGIEWTDYTWNAVQGCAHECIWEMPDGKLAECYAKTVAHKMRSATFYPRGFVEHYWNPQRLEEPGKLRKPAKIFLDSMSDLMGHWVTEEQILAVLEVCRKTPQHQYQLLTKNAPRLLKFEFPDNVWVGVSAPPTYMMGRKLSLTQQIMMVNRQLEVLKQVQARVKWMSIEPLSFDIGEVFVKTNVSESINWCVIGAASNGQTIYQPYPQILSKLLAILDGYSIPVFFKGNLRGNDAASEWRANFPVGK